MEKEYGKMIKFDEESTYWDSQSKTGKIVKLRADERREEELSPSPGRDEGPEDYRRRREERKLLREKRIQMRRRRRMIALGICIMAIVMSLLLAIVSSLTSGPKVPPGPSEEAPPVSSINGIPVIDSILPEGIPGRPGETRRVQYIVIHETGNTDSGAHAASHNNYIHTAAAEKMLSWHYTVDDSEIYHHLPDNEIAFHAGDRFTENGGNMNGIGIEMCVNPENDFEKTLENAAALVAYLLKAYGLSLDDVKMHYDFSGKICPETLIEEDRWQEFLDIVKNVEVDFITAK